MTATETTPTEAPPIAMLDPTFWRDRQHEAWTWCRANDPEHRDELAATAWERYRIRV